MDATNCTYCTDGDERDYRVDVCGEIITVRATSGRSARAKARSRYVYGHDWFACDDPWRTTRHAKVLA